MTWEVAVNEETIDERGQRNRTLLRAGAVAIAILAALSMVLGGMAEAHQHKDTWEQRKHVRSRAKSQRGAPYRYGGTTPRGFDCSGFTRWTWKKHGADLPHSSTAQFDLAKRNKHKRVWKRKRLKVGDLVFHKTTGSRVGHAGIYIGKGRFISSTSSGGVRIRSLYDSYWGPRWVGATRLAPVIRG